MGERDQICSLLRGLDASYTGNGDRVTFAQRPVRQGGVWMGVAEQDERGGGGGTAGGYLMRDVNHVDIPSGGKVR